MQRRGKNSCGRRRLAYWTRKATGFCVVVLVEKTVLAERSTVTGVPIKSIGHSRRGGMLCTDSFSGSLLSEPRLRQMLVQEVMCIIFSQLCHEVVLDGLNPFY
mmetsp:Transcript_7860/g.21611  ORF Transcript_7860/g.21611 Transcript_7860/m.21611 type:complete len:103 (-) Transcript_7860:47-355(-)